MTALSLSRIYTYPPPLQDNPQGGPCFQIQALLVLGAVDLRECNYSNMKKTQRKKQV